MAAPQRALLTGLSKGHPFPPTSFSFTRNELERYLAAVEDGNTLYRERGLAPPLAVAARALGVLLELMELPAGTLHTGQEVEARAPVPLDVPLTLSGRVAQRSERAGMVISVLEFEVTAERAPGPAVAGRTTVMAPGGPR
jgi:hypothetical protein